jgi:hypothetical protein
MFVRIKSLNGYGDINIGGYHFFWEGKWIYIILNVTFFLKAF